MKRTDASEFELAAGGAGMQAKSIVICSVRAPSVRHGSA